MTSTANEQVPIEANQSSVILRSDYTPCAYEIDDVYLKFELDCASTIVTSCFSFRRTTSGITPFPLDGYQLQLVRISLNGIELADDEFIKNDTQLTILRPPEFGKIEVVTEITPQGVGGEGLLYFNDVFITQCEPEGFRQITYFPDRPDIMARYRCAIVADEKSVPILLSNGNLVEKGQYDDGRHFATWEDPHPKASYLFALVAGNLTTVTERIATKSGRPFDISVHAVPELLEHCGESIDTLKKAIRWDEQYYEREYDLDVLNIVVIRNYPGGAMENKGLNLYGAEYFCSSLNVSTDVERANVHATVAHEYFHNWTGNRVGSRSWFELCLKEGFTVFRQQQFVAQEIGQDIARIDEVKRLQDNQFPEEEGGGAHSVRPESYLTPNNLYTATVYQKGAELIRMLASMVEVDEFYDAARSFFAKYDGRAATIEDLIVEIENIGRVDLQQFRKWYSAEGPVSLHVEGEYNPVTQEYTLQFHQSGPMEALPLAIPVRMALLSQNGKPIALQESGNTKPVDEEIYLVTENNEKVTFQDVRCKPIPSLLRQYSAPVRLNTDLEIDSLVLLATRDSDQFSRWDSVQKLTMRALMDSDNQAAIDGWKIVCSFLLRSEEIDMGLRARLLVLPTEELICRQQKSFNIDKVRRRRRELAAKAEVWFGDQFRALYQSLSEAANESERVRSFRNQCLWYIMRNPSELDISACWNQFNASRPFENVWVAARHLVDQGGDCRTAALQKAYAKWCNDKLLLDKWFSVQAASAAPDCAKLTNALMTHPEFHFSDTARVKALFDSFTNNFSAFHDESGQGYEVIFNGVFALREDNPRFAARLLKKFDAWPHLDVDRQMLIKKYLEKIVTETNVSKDLYEIAHNSLRKQ